MPPQTTKPFVVIALALLGAPALRAQAPGPDTLRLLADIHHAVASVPAIWPGFRPDTFPMAYVLRGRGVLLLGWRGAPPEGYAPAGPAGHGLWLGESARGAASTAVDIGGRAVAQVVVGALDRAALVGVSAHEAFHAFAGSVRREGRRFGRGENAFWVSQYPVFDVENETDWALEGRLLGAALAARDTDEVRRLARGFVAVRRARHARMGAELAEFEAMSELNEGLAQYAEVRASSATAELARLDSLTAGSSLSVRRRFYTTGSAMGLLLDRLAGDAWKGWIVEDNVTLQDALARASGLDLAADALRAEAARRFDRAHLAASAAQGVRALRAARRRQADSLLARPGIQLVLDGGFGQCQFDPQNMLRVDSAAVLHTRWLLVCRGQSLRGEFNTPVLTDATRATAVIGEEQEVRLSVGGAPVALAGLTALPAAPDVRIESPGLTLRVARADVSREGRVLRIRPVP